MRTTWTLLVMLWTAPSAWAGDLQGTWTLDLEASESLDPLLKEQGVSWLKRKAIANLNVTQTLARSGDEVTVKLESSARNQQETLRVDGVVRTVEGERGTMQVSHTWDDDALVTVQQRATEQGTATVTIRREADDTGTLTQTVTLVKPDGTTIAIDRIFRGARYSDQSHDK